MITISEDEARAYAWAAGRLGNEDFARFFDRIAEFISSDQAIASVNIEFDREVAEVVTEVIHNERGESGLEALIVDAERIIGRILTLEAKRDENERHIIPRIERRRLKVIADGWSVDLKRLRNMQDRGGKSW